MPRTSLLAPTELADDGGLPALLAAREASVALLGCPEEGGDACVGRAAP